MRVAIIQSSFVPWRGYFDILDRADLFVLHDDIQYTKQDWRNRNRIVTPQGLVWMSVPVKHKGVGQTIEETEIAYGNWRAKHLNILRQHYRRAPFFAQTFESYQAIVDARARTISELNAALIRWIAGVLDIETPIRFSRELRPHGQKTERVLSILEAVGATTYLSGPRAQAYLEEDEFRRRGIGLEYMCYDYPAYPQLHGQREAAASTLDLIFNCGSRSRHHLRSKSEPEIRLAPAVRLVA